MRVADHALAHPVPVEHHLEDDEVILREGRFRPGIIAPFAIGFLRATALPAAGKRSSGRLDGRRKEDQQE